MSSEAYIYEAIRTPRGKGRASGALHGVTPIRLLQTLLGALQQRALRETALVDDLLLGCVTPVGEQGANLARTALLAAGWDECVLGIQVNRFCASGLETVNLAAAKVRAGWADLVVAGGVESMSRIPIGSDGGALMDDPVISQQIGFVPQGISADLIATLEGAALVLLGSAEAGVRLGLRPRARIVATALVGTEPTIMLTGPAPATRKALRLAGMTLSDIDLWEVNEAFAAVVLKFMADMALADESKINVNGGAIALGHPLGATGAMLLGTALDELERREQATALITLCAGGGMGIATIIERV